jgi:hypothetical protein
MAKRPTSGNRRQGSETELTLRATGDMQPLRAAHKICGTNERRTSGLARGEKEDLVSEICSSSLELAYLR